MVALRHVARLSMRRFDEGVSGYLEVPVAWTDTDLQSIV
jgi:hypothetical protein